MTYAPGTRNSFEKDAKSANYLLSISIDTSTFVRAECIKLLLREARGSVRMKCTISVHILRSEFMHPFQVLLKYRIPLDVSCVLSSLKNFFPSASSASFSETTLAVVTLVVFVSFCKQGREDASLSASSGLVHSPWEFSYECLNSNSIFFLSALSHLSSLSGLTRCRTKRRHSSIVDSFFWFHDTSHSKKRNFRRLFVTLSIPDGRVDKTRYVWSDFLFIQVGYCCFKL